jgi:hypothetical protein
MTSIAKYSGETDPGPYFAAAAGMLKKTVSCLILAASCVVAGCSSTTSPSPASPASPPAASAIVANATVGAQGGKQPTPPPLPDIAIVVQGLVNGLFGQCPDRTFVLGNRIVITSAATKYSAGACEALVFSQRVDVTGIADGFILRALDIRQQKNKDRP